MPPGGIDQHLGGIGMLLEKPLYLLPVFISQYRACAVQQDTAWHEQGPLRPQNFSLPVCQLRNVITLAQQLDVRVAPYYTRSGTGGIQQDAVILPAIPPCRRLRGISRQQLCLQ